MLTGPTARCTDKLHTDSADAIWNHSATKHTTGNARETPTTRTKTARPRNRDSCTIAGRSLTWHGFWDPWGQRCSSDRSHNQYDHVLCSIWKSAGRQIEMQHTFSRVRTHFSFGHPDKYSLVSSAGILNVFSFWEDGAACGGTARGRRRRRSPPPPAACAVFLKARLVTRADFLSPSKWELVTACHGSVTTRRPPGELPPPPA